MVGLGGCVDFMIRERVVATIAVQLRLDERFLVQVLAFLLVLIDPEVGKHLRNLVGHQSREDGVAGILRSGGQDAEVEVFVDVELVANLLRQHAPLVVAEVVEHDDEHLLALVEQWEHLALEDVGREQRSGIPSPLPGRLRGSWRHPVQIVFLHELGKAQVGLFLLHGQHVGHLRVGAAQLQFPVHQPLVDFHPVLPGAAVHDLHGNLLELLLILALCHLGLYLAAMDVLLQRQQNLVGVHGLDEIVGNLLPDGLLHDVLLLALGDHHHGRGRRNLLDALQRLQPAESRHLLVEQYQVEGALLAQVYGIGAVAGGGHFVALLLEEDDMGLQQLHLIVDPQ